MSTRSRFRIRVHAERCTGCRTCQYRCSWRFNRAFQPSTSAIIVHRTGASVASDISFTAACDSCGICARACPYGSLELVPGRPAAL